MSTQAQQSRPERVEELESVRGLAALLIVFYHVPLWHSVLDVPLLRNAYLMVELFFVLSGLVIYEAYFKKINGTRDLIRFQFLRFGRLYPVHILLLLVFVLIECVKYLAQEKYGIVSPNGGAFQNNNATEFVRHVFLLQGFQSPSKLTFNVPSWSIGVEFYTYLLFALLVLAGGRFKKGLFTAISFAAIALIASGNTGGFDFILRCFAGFFLGCVTAFLNRNVSGILPKWSAAAAAAAIVVFLSLKRGHVYDMLIFPLSALLILSLISGGKSLFKDVLRWKPLIWLGTVSYSLYMCHMVLVWVVNQVFRVLLKRPEIVIDDRSTPQLSLGEAVVGVAVIIGLSLVCAGLLYRFVETPWREKSRRFAAEKLT